MMRKFGIQLMLIFISTISLYGQNDFRNGFIVDLEKDTIYGQLDYRLNTKNYISCLFKSGDAITEYTPSQITGFGFTDDKYFISQILRNRFVEVLVTGALSLYKSEDKYLIKKDTSIYILEEKNILKEIDGIIIGTKSTQWRGILTLLIRDCLKNPYQLTSKVTLSDKRLVQLIVIYNNCKGTPMVEFKAKKPWSKVNFGFSTGIVKSIIYYDESSNVWRTFLDRKYSTYAPTAGLFAEISFPRINERISTQVGVNFVKTSFTSTVIAVPWQYDNINTSTIDLSTLSMPVSVKYEFPVKGLFLLNIQVGLNFDYHLNTATSGLHQEVGGTTQFSFTPFETQNFQTGYWGGIGFTKPFKKFKIGITLRRFKMSEITKPFSEIRYKTKYTNCSLFVLL